MSSLMHHRTGLIAHAVRALSPEAPHSPPRLASDVLASLLDLRGSVRLEAELAAPALEDVPGLRPSLLLTDYVRARFDAIEASAARRLATPFHGRLRVPDAAAMHAELTGPDGTLASLPAREVKVAARVLGRPFRELLAGSLERTLGDVASLREELKDDLRALGPHAAQLESLDATLRSGTEDGIGRLFERLGAAVEASFARGLARAWKALPANATVTSLAPWFAPGGFVHAELTRIGAVTRGVLGHERAVIEALVTSASRAGAEDE